MAQRIVFHVDANSAFLSWSAAYRVKVLGEALDLRTVPSVVAGDKESRHSIILAKSAPAKKYGIQTGEPLFQALEKCPELKIVEPDYSLYVECSRHFVEVLRSFSPVVEQYSIDEAWVDMTGTERLFGPPVLAADALRRRVYEELGFTVNVGISTNKLLAKMAGDFEKPNKVHTLFPEEIPAKMWPLSVRDLFLVGAATERKLKLLVNCDDSSRLRAARDIAKTLTELGIPCGTLEYSGSTHPTYQEVLSAGTYDIYLGQTRLSPNYNLCEFFRLWGNLSWGGLPTQEILDMCTKSLANSGNYYNLMQKLADDGRIIPVLFGHYNVYATRGMFDGLDPARDNCFYYSLGKTMSDIQIATVYD